MLHKTLPALVLISICTLTQVNRATAGEPIATPQAKRPDIVFRMLNGPEFKLLNALDDETTLEFIETPLEDVSAFISDLHNLPVQIDSRAFRAADISTDVNITYLAKRVSLGSALNLMLQAEGLAYMVKDEALIITTPAVVATTQMARVYDVTSLLPKDEDSEDPVTVDVIAETISGAIAPVTWSEAGGAGSVKAITLNGRSLLVINQTFDAHQQIFKLLTDLQNSAK